MLFYALFLPIPSNTIDIRQNKPDIKRDPSEPRPVKEKSSPQPKMDVITPSERSSYASRVERVVCRVAETQERTHGYRYISGMMSK
ncbi:hypothetical protein BJ165DRAFT_1455285 [Panaeolus papilionaceus]|nr:hypothetical protein BJ165DRAFT_1455285 [Panaeolus papilionaceus]